MRVLHLTLKKKWFDMIASGEKKEEYRENKLYWKNRFYAIHRIHKHRTDHFREFDAVEFTNGGNFHESHPKLLIEWKGIEIGTGKPEWGAEPGKEYFVIKLGEIIK